MLYFVIRRLVRRIKRARREQEVARNYYQQSGSIIDPPPQNQTRVPRMPAAPLPPPGSDLKPTLLPVPEPLPPKDRMPWNVIKNKPFGQAQTSVGQASDGQLGLRVDFVPGSVGSKSGYGFYASPPSFPAHEVAFSYQVYFPPNFDFVKGGKLPGIFIGAPGATGGNWENNAGSVRVMWGKGGKATAYVYIPTQVCPCGTRESMLQVQGSKYSAICHETKMGHHLWGDGSLRFKTGEWNSIHIRVRMNDPGSRNGRLELRINEQYRSFDEMVWRTDPGLCFEGLCVMTFFGGHTEDFAVPLSGAHCIFKDFVVWSVLR